MFFINGLLRKYSKNSVLLTELCPAPSPWTFFMVYSFVMQFHFWNFALDMTAADERDKLCILTSCDGMKLESFNLKFTLLIWIKSLKLIAVQNFCSHVLQFKSFANLILFKSPTQNYSRFGVRKKLNQFYCSKMPELFNTFCSNKTPSACEKLET